MREVIKVLFTKDVLAENSQNVLCRSRAIVSAILGIAAMLMLFQNIRNGSTVMAYASAVLVAGFLISSVVAGLLKKTTMSGVLIALLVGFVLSVFAITGGNQGFAILWILLVPMFSVSLLGITSGLIVSTYFLVFIFVIFKTPYNVNMTDLYTSSFIAKFPVLYLCDYAIATYFSLQREYLQKQLHIQAHVDGMTGLYNRRTFMEQLQACSGKSVYSILMVDLNGLKVVNDGFGHEAGDDFICQVSKICTKVFNKNALVCRIGGDEIAIISYEDKNTVNKKIKELHELENKAKGKFSYKVSFSTGVAYSEDNERVIPEELFKLADAEMYKSKSAYYRDNNNNRRRRAD